MNGKIIHYNEEKCYGFILGEDAEKYFFHITNTEEPLEIKNKLFVKFEPIQGKKNKLAAVDISIINKQKKYSQNKIMINDEVVLTSSIISYKLITEDPKDCTKIGIFDNEDIDYYSDDNWRDHYIDGYCEHDEEYWYIDDLLYDIDSYISDHFTYWNGAESFNETLYLKDLEKNNDQKKKYFIKIKFKNGKSKRYFIGEYVVPYRIIWDEKYTEYVNENFKNSTYNWHGCSEFTAYQDIKGNLHRDDFDNDNVVIYDIDKLAIRLPKLEYTEIFNEQNEFYQKSLKIIEKLNQLV